nr:glutathione S-transferase T3-like [Tanacetum cinerariifolium]
MAKRAMVDLVDDDEEKEQTRQCERWIRDEEILLTQCWIETSENGAMGRIPSMRSREAPLIRHLINWDTLAPNFYKFCSIDNNPAITIMIPGIRMAKRAMVDLVDDDEEEEQTRQCERWIRDEEILLTQCWIETSENGQIGANRTEDSFWGQIMDDFNSGTTQGYCTRHMLTGK